MPDAIFDRCTFERSWVGRCDKPCHGRFCTEHEKLKCVSCGAAATQDCEYAGQFVCGAPLCGECGYEVESEIPSGMFFMRHTHVRKAR